MAPGEWLDEQLSGRGANNLPYRNDAKPVIRQHLLDFVTDFPSLILRSQQYTHTNGAVVPLLMAEGTIPMYYQGVKYNIPVQIWLPEAYARQPPIMYVVPTSTMIIKPNHSFVDASGVVSSPYVRNWIPGRSNLVDMAQDTSIQFGQDPPLFSKPPDWRPPSAAQRPPETFQAHNPIHGPGNAQSAAQPGGGIWSGAMAAMTGGRPPPQSPPPAPPPAAAQPENLEEAFRKIALEQLKARVQGSLKRANASATGDMDRLLEQQSELTRRDRDVSAGVDSVQSERHALEACVLEMAGKSAALERWLADNEKKAVTGDINPDTAIVPADVLSKQALDGQAEDLAMEDTLYALEKAMQAGSLAPDVYIKQVRNLCGRQFMVRALGKKIANRQNQLKRAYQNAPQQAQQSSSRTGSTPGPSHVQMPQGDSWVSLGILSNPLTQAH